MYLNEGVLEAVKPCQSPHVSASTHALNNNADQIRNPLEHHATPQQAIYATKIFIPRSSGGSRHIKTASNLNAEGASHQPCKEEAIAGSSGINFMLPSRARN